jgi:predicted RNase H-like HicB family nuclease
VAQELDLTIIYESGEDDWIVASIPEVAGVFSQGRTREEARSNVIDALRLMLSPEPRVAALDAHLLTSSDTIVGLAAHLAARPGIEVTSDDVALALALPYGWKSLAGALGAFVRYLRNRGFEDAQG